MASPVSFGDVVAMAKIAKAVAQAFTRGRKSAPAEFREVENQLHSLSAALSTLKDAFDSSAQPPALAGAAHQDGGQTVSGLLESCNDTLKHLQKIVEKYGVIAERRDPNKSLMQRWSQELVKNYKKIAWTTKAGDLAMLRSQLMIHTNSLDLVLGIIIKSSRIEDCLRENSDKLSDIYTWWAENLKESTTAASAQDKSAAVWGSPSVIFEVYIETDRNLQLICPDAALHDNWKENGTSRLFVCRCRPNAGFSGHSHEHSKLESIALSPITFPFRQVGGARAWTLYKAMDHSSNKLVSVVVKNVPIGDIADFEDTFIHAISEARAVAMLRQGVSNMLAHPSPDGQRMRILNMKGDLAGIQKFVDSVTFAVGHRTLSRTDVNGLSLLHYREPDGNSAPRAGSGLDYAEVLIHFDEQSALSSADVTRSELRLRRNGVVRTEEGVAVVMQAVECFGFVKEEQRNRIEKTDVTFHMTTAESAQRLYQKLEDMKMELFVQSLQFARPDETLALHLQATQVQCEEVCIADAEMLITRDQQDKFRLIILSRNRCIVLSQVLADTFFAEPISKGGARFASSTWLVELESPGVRKVYHYPKGFKFLNLHSIHAERMFELGRTTITQTATVLPIRGAVADSN